MPIDLATRPRHTVVPHSLAYRPCLMAPPQGLATWHCQPASLNGLSSRPQYRPLLKSCVFKQKSGVE